MNVEHNVVLNPKHPAFGRLPRTTPVAVPIDGRVLALKK
jgi:hypothetical protein